MRNQRFSLRRGGALMLAASVALGVGFWVCAESRVFAESDPSATDGSDSKHFDTVKKKKHRNAAKAQPKPAAPPQTVASKTEAPPAPAKPAETKTSGAIDFGAQFDKAGGSACKGQVNALATSTMGSVEKFNTVANWSQTGGDKRAVSLAIGQKYAAGSAVPFSVSQVISTPNPQGSCDGFTVQVFPSPLSCAKLRDSMVAQRGQQIGDLAGIPLMQDAAGRTMLVPTKSDTCVLVATRAFYSR